jgi:hypothetical protein
MRTVKWNAFLSGLCGLAVALGVMASSALADVTIEKGSSILVFPKVRADGTYDTIIQIGSTSTSPVHALCYYVNATLFSTITGAPCSVPSATCVPSWQETDFTIWFTKEQPTHWLVSTGRQVDPFDGFGYDGSGFDPGHVPPMIDFEGELKCIEVTEAGDPITGNHLKGEATIETVGEQTKWSSYGDVSKYNAIGIPGLDVTPEPGQPLMLDDSQYAACPAKLIVDHFATLAPDPVVSETAPGIGSASHTELTLVPCSEDFENQLPTTVTVQFLVFNEFEERFSASTTVSCYLNTELTYIDSPTSPDRSVFSFNVLGTDVAQTQITPVVTTGGTQHGVIGVAERFLAVEFDGVTEGARAAYNIHTVAKVCSGGPSQGAACTSGADCPDGTCSGPLDQILLTQME